jgi:hypothetical protein
MIGQSILDLRFPSSKKWECEFEERWEINQLKSWRDEENRENIEVGIYRMENLSRDHCKVHTMLKPTLSFDTYLPTGGFNCYDWCMNI